MAEFTTSQQDPNFQPPIPSPDQLPQESVNPANGNIDPTSPQLAPPAEMPPPTPSPSPTPAPENDDVSGHYAEHNEDNEGMAALKDLQANFGTPGQPTTTDGSTPAPVKKPEAGTGKSIILDMATGAMEAPTAIKAGVVAAANNMSALGNSLGDWLNKEFPNAHVKDYTFRGVKVFNQHLDEGGQPKSVTGNLIKGVSQFLTGFIGPGGAVKGAGIIPSLAKGAIADFTAFNKSENAVHDLVEKFPVLKNPVTEFLAGDPNDSEVVGRLRNSLTGLGLGALTEGVSHALGYVKAGKIADAAQAAAGKVEGGEAMQAAAREAELKPLDVSVMGDLDKPLMSSVSPEEKKIIDGMVETQDMKPSDVKGRAKSGPEVYINWAKVDTPADIQTIMKKTANAAKAQIDEGRRGIVTFDDTKLAAEQVDAWKTLMERRQGEPLNDHQSLASRQLWAASAQKLGEVAKLAASNPSEEVQFFFRKQLAVHNAIQKEVIAARTETARALNAWKIPAGTGKFQMQQMQSILEAAGGGGTSQDFAKKIAMLADAGKYGGMEQMVEKGAFARTRDAVSQVWINSLLSNPQTHVANTLSNFVGAFMQVYERGTAEYLTQKLGTQNGVELGEAAAMLNGASSAMKDMFVATAQKIRSTPDKAGLVKDLISGENEGFFEATKGGAAKVEEPAPGALSADRWNVNQQSPMGRALDTLDVATRVPGRLLQVSDDIYKMMGYRMELHAQAVRRATQEMRGGNLSSEEFSKRVAAIVANPPADIHIESVNAATYATFTSKPAAVLKGIGDAIQKIPVFGRMILPFKNTPINVLTFAGERSPMAPLIKSWRADVAAGGARRDVALARLSTGTAIMSMVMDQALQGNITGKGPSESGKHQLKQREGWQPYSVKLPNGTYMSYQRFDPIGMTMGWAADISEAVLNAQSDVEDEHFEKAFAHGIFGISNNVMSKTYMQGLSDVMAAVTNPDARAEGYFQKVTSSTVGALAGGGLGSNVARQIDPYQRTVEDSIDALRRRVPGLSDDLPLYRDLWGREVSYRSPMGAVYDFFVPVYLRNEHKEPVDAELEKLGYFPEMPNKKMAIKGLPESGNGNVGVSIELNGKQYSRLMELAGNGVKLPQYDDLGAKDYLNSLVTGKAALSGYYNDVLSDGPDGGKAEHIRSVIDKYRDAAKQQLMREDPKLQATFDAKRKLKNGKINPALMGGQ